MRNNIRKKLKKKILQ